ncbi:large subunit ribosomal protein L35 [Entomortierella parvispora]|uniref:50S ribosomal protein L35 n=1 Tax=Entomortierella parvispora TaxID=205924 RepID=A0A9P3HIK3_9FUNG|nr:large subunit ribosomal protein L35 [Entomortierella parvispora]
MSAFLRSTLALAWSPLKSASKIATSLPVASSTPSTTNSVLCNAVRHMSYKLKTNSAAKKRFVALPSGKFKHWRSGKRHINTGMDRGRLNKAGIASYATPRQCKHLRRLMPYA